MLSLPTDERLYRLDTEFADHVSQLHPQLIKLLACVPFFYSDLPSSLPTDVVYLFSDGDAPFYVGRSRKFRQRIGNHCNPSSAVNQSSTAYKMACETVNYTPIPYAKGSSAKDNIVSIAGLADAFSEAKRRLSAMHIRYVEERDPVRQALLEIYCAVALKTRNSWKTS